MKWFSSDWHLSHNNVISWSGRPFENVEEMDEAIIKNMINSVKPGDDFYFLGDLSWSVETTKKFFDRWPHNVNFHWVLGNHEKKQWKQYQHRCASISPMKEVNSDKNKITLCHYPMLTWNKSHYNSWMLFGHHHKNSHGSDVIDGLTRGKMLNVNVEFHYFMPWSEKEVAEYMAGRPNNWDYIEKK